MCTQEYQPPHAVFMICATPVSTHMDTHTHTGSFQPAILHRVRKKKVPLYFCL